VASIAPPQAAVRSRGDVHAARYLIAFAVTLASMPYS
jgi:hypothetical protein